MAAGPVGGVEMYSTTLPERPYQEVAIISVEAVSTYDKTSTVLHALRKRAAAAGCDAVIINGRADKVTGHSVHSGNTSVAQNQASGTTTLKTQMSGSTYVGTKEGFWGACILWREKERHITLAPKKARSPRSEPSDILRHRPALAEIKTRVEAELLKEGISLERLDTAVSLTTTSGDRGITVALIDRSRGELVTFKKLTRLPKDREAMIAHLLVVVRSLIESVNSTNS